MKTRFNLIPVLLATFILYTACGGTEPPRSPIPTTTIKDFNVLFVPDLSNRINADLYPKPVHDTILLNHALGQIRHFCSLNNRKTGQQDIYKLDFINKGVLSRQAVRPSEMEINLRKFGNDMVKRANYFRQSLQPDTEKFKTNVGSLYDYAAVHPSGADVWNYFNETIRGSLLDVPEAVVLQTKNNIVVKANKNVAVLLTDGYIESANKGQGYLVNGETIDKIRKDYNSSGSHDLKQFVYAHKDYAINKTTQSLSGLNVLVCEVVDRSLDKNGAARVQPTDFQIMELLWTRWLTDSGCDQVKVQQAVKTPEEFGASLETFLSSL